MKRSTGIVSQVGRHIVGLAIVSAVIVGVAVGGFEFRSYVKAHTTAKTAQAQIANDGTTHDMTIVWPTGKEQTLTYSETITPKRSSYTGPVNTHSTKISMFSMNPLDSANKAGERIPPATFAEGDRPALVLNDSGVTASKTEGANSTGMGGSNPVFGEYLGWVGFIILGLIGIWAIFKVGQWLWPKIEAGAEAALAAVSPAAAVAVAAAKPSAPVAPVVLPPAPEATAVAPAGGAATPTAQSATQTAPGVQEAAVAVVADPVVVAPAGPVAGVQADLAAIKAAPDGALVSVTTDPVALMKADRAAAITGDPAND